MTIVKEKARVSIKAINQDFEDDMKRYWPMSREIKGVRPKEENQSFQVFAHNKKYSGTRKRLDDAVELLREVNASEAAPVRKARGS